MRQIIGVFLVLLVNSCNPVNQREASTNIPDYSEIISAGIKDLLPGDSKTMNPYSLNQMLFLDKFTDTVQNKLSLNFLEESNLLRKETFDSIKRITKSNSDFWYELSELNPDKEVIIYFTLPLVKSDTAQFEFTWQGMLKGSGKTYVINCIQEEGKWTRTSAVVSMEF